MRSASALFVVLALAGILAGGCASQAAGPFAAAAAAAGGGKEKPSLIFKGFSARASHSGEIVWEAQAAHAVVNHEGVQADAEDVTMLYYSRGRQVSHGRANHAVIDLRTYDLKADGAVEVRSSEGVILRTPHLDWDNRQQRISSSSRVEILKGRTRLTGRGFRGDRDLRDVRVLSEVQAEALSVEALREDSKSWPQER
jgi:LPS export ABC transporter protein LptC